VLLDELELLDGNEVCAGAQGLQPGSVLLHLLPFSACPMKPSSLPESRFA